MTKEQIDEQIRAIKDHTKFVQAQPLAWRKQYLKALIGEAEFPEDPTPPKEEPIGVEEEKNLDKPDNPHIFAIESFYKEFPRVALPDSLEWKVFKRAYIMAFNRGSLREALKWQSNQGKYSEEDMNNAYVAGWDNQDKRILHKGEFIPSFEWLKSYAPSLSKQDKI